LEVILLPAMTTKEKVLYLLLMLFLSTLYFHNINAINIAITVLLALYCFAFNSLSEKWNLLKSRPHVQCMLLLFVVSILSAGLSEDTSRGMYYLNLQLPLLVFPLSLGLIRLSKGFKEKVLLSFAVLTTFIGVLCLGYSMYKFTVLQRSDIFYNDNLTSVLGRQSVYIALLVNVSLFIYAYFIIYKEVAYKALMLVASVFLIGILYLLASRVNLIILGLVVTGFSAYYIYNKKRYLEGATLVLGVLMAMAIIHKFFPQTTNRFTELTYSKFEFEHRGAESHFNVEVTEDQWNGANFRLAAWTCGWEMFQSSPVLGVGLGDKDGRLLEKFKEKNFHFALETGKNNVHNLYLDTLLCLGIVGFVLLMAGWILFPLWLAIKAKDGVAILVILTFAIAWFTEVYFSRSMGAFTAGFFIPFMLIDLKTSRAVTWKKPKSNKVVYHHV
jgi:O-antigen ligase